MGDLPEQRRDADDWRARSELVAEIRDAGRELAEVIRVELDQLSNGILVRRGEPERYEDPEREMARKLEQHELKIKISREVGIGPYVDTGDGL